MRATIEQKALAAVFAYAKAQAEIKRLKDLIGDSLGACHDAWLAVNPDDGERHPLSWESHLSAAYSHFDEEETQYTSGRRIYCTSEEQQEILDECPHCLAAHQAIQQRKIQRKALGAAKRQITMIGRASGSQHE